jgi:CubicO group peptidase (beta-lactamase class C family)
MWLTSRPALALLVTLSIWVVHTSAQSGSATAEQANAVIRFDYQDQITEWLAANHVPAVGIGIIERGAIKEVKVFGELRPHVQAPLNALFNVASLTKPVTALTVLKLVSDGQWRLDEPISKYWIDPDVKDDPRYERLTTRIILSHQTGFVNWRSLTPSHELTFAFEPGTRFGYSGEGYEYLRRAVERKFGETLQQLADSLLFKPLGMKHTRYGWDDQMDGSRFAEPHDENGTIVSKTVSEGVPGDMKKRKGISAADWLVTTVSDYTRFGVYVLRGGGLSKGLYRDMATPQVAMRADVAKEVDGMGLGWEVIQNLPHGEYALTHDGSDVGAKTLIMLLPKSRRGIVVFTNGENGRTVISNILKASFSDGDLRSALAR